MYHVRKIRKTKKDPDKASYIVSLPKGILQRTKSRNPEISRRLEHLPRVRCAWQAGSGCFLVAVSSHELPPKGHSKDGTTTIQRSGRTSRYVIIPKKACKMFDWKAGTELVIGFSYGIPEAVHDEIYRGAEFLAGEAGPEVLVVRFQRYQDMRDLYAKRLAGERAILEEARDEMLWKARHDDTQFEGIVNTMGRWKKDMRRQVWDLLYSEGLVSVQYGEYVRLRADLERERRRKRRQKHGISSSWNYRKNFIKGYGTDWDARREAMLDDPGMLHELGGDDPEAYGFSGGKPGREADQDWSS